MSKTYELSYTAERIDEMLKEVDEHTIYSDATTEEHGLMSTTDKTKLDALPTAQQIDGALNAKVDKEAGKGLSKNDYTDAEKAKVASALQSETDPTVPSWAKQQNKPSYDYSEIGNTPDLSGFITKSVNDLTNYYLKSETYTKAEVAALIGAIQQFHYEIYATLPQTGHGNVLYLIGPTGSGSDRYEEYVYANNAFTKIGDTSIDLSGYVTTSALNTALADYTTTANLTTLLSNKADKVSNATNGNFAGLDANGNLTDSGKKASDFATSSQGTKADTAYQKPQPGIPESDLSPDVQQALQKHFKGWYDSSSNLPANPVVGDYAYVKGAETTDSAAIYECTANGSWSDSERTVDTNNVQTFASNEEVNEVHIVKDLTTGGIEDVLSAEQGKILSNNDLILKSFIYTINKNNFEDILPVIDGYINSQGGFGTYGSYKCSDYLPVISGQTLIVQNYQLSTTFAYSYFYDNQKQPLSVVTYTQGTNEVVIPSNAAYIRLSMSSTDQGKKRTLAYKDIDLSRIKELIYNNGIYDISLDTGTSYTDLSTALAAVNVTKRKSGLNIKYKETSTDKYRQYRYLLKYENTTAGNNAFINEFNWQCIDDMYSLKLYNELIPKYLVGIELSDVAKYIGKSIYANSGNERDAQSWCCSDYIFMSKGDSLAYSIRNDNTANASIYKYDIWKKPVSLISAVSGTTTGTFTATEDCYIRISSPKIGFSVLSLTLTTISPSKDYLHLVQDLKEYKELDKISYSNFRDFSNDAIFVNADKAIRNGDYVSQSGYTCSNLIHLLKGDSITYNLYTNNPAIYNIGIFALKNTDFYIKSVATGNPCNGTYTATEDCYIRVCTQTSKIGLSYVRLNGVEKPTILKRLDVLENLSNNDEFTALFFGNSMTQDAVGYLPLLLQELGIRYKLYIWYVGGAKLSTQWSSYVSQGEPCAGFYLCENSTTWAAAGEKTLDYILLNYNFNVFCLQEYFNGMTSYTQTDIDAYNNIVNYVREHYSKPFKVVSLLHQPGVSKSSDPQDARDTDAIFTLAKSSMISQFENTPCESIIPCGFSIQDARETSLDELGDGYGHHLCADGTHIQEGVTGIIQPYTVAMWILKELDITKSILGSQVRMTQDVYTALGVPGPNGTLIVGTEEQYALAQDCAIRGFKQGLGLINTAINQLNT